MGNILYIKDEKEIQVEEIDENFITIQEDKLKYIKEKPSNPSSTHYSNLHRDNMGESIEYKELRGYLSSDLTKFGKLYGHTCKKFAFYV